MLFGPYKSNSKQQLLFFGTKVIDGIITELKSFSIFFGFIYFIIIVDFEVIYYKILIFVSIEINFVLNDASFFYFL